MRIVKYAGCAALASLAVLAAGTANAVWLASDPGTPISLQVNMDGHLVVRPIGGTWSHPLCPNVTAAELGNPSRSRRHERIAHYVLAQEMLIAAAASGSLVNLFTETDECNEHGQPIVRNVRIQAP